INHLLAHLYASFMVKDSLPKLPAIGFVISGGHTELFYIKEFNDAELLGKTRDDACGEAFDKVAKILGLGFPGGPFIEKWAKQGKDKIPFKCARLKNSLDFSFSGIKTAVLYYVKKIAPNDKQLTGNEIADICASFQEKIVEVLVEKAQQACIMKRVKSLILGGGVVANTLLRKRMEEMAKKEAIKVFFPPFELCMDNAAMVAGLGYRLYKLEKIKSDYSLEPKPVSEI
ncbi:MAG: tRNA (adenosine(37)-N6)-threonylcarbamoyltransferase complex transferase subunit TsaD, partial [Candidatus Omnitrophota bacterium]